MYVFGGGDAVEGDGIAAVRLQSFPSGIFALGGLFLIVLEALGFAVHLGEGGNTLSM